MGIERLSMRVLAGLTLFAGFGLTAQAQPPVVTVEDALRRLPKQPGVEVSTPASAQVGQCKVETIPNKNDPKSPLGYVVRDPAGNPVRQFVSYDGKTYNIVAYYINGTEAYREVFPPAPNEPHQYRWLGPNGTKWGLDRDRDGRIDEWVVLSPEELSQELFQAILTKDAKRAEALAVSKANLDQLGLPQAEAQKLLARAASAPKRAADAAEAPKLSPDARWGSLQLGSPQATPADAMGARDDLVIHKTGTVLILDGKDGKEPKTLQTGELVQIGRAWKLVDGPITGGSESAAAPMIPANIRELVVKLNDLDQKEMPNPPTREALAAYNAKRAVVLEEIVSRVAGAEQDVWVKQLVDSLSGAADVEKPGDRHITRLKSIKESLAKGPNQALAAYVAFRTLQTENNIALATNTGPVEPVQEKWRAGLEDFVKTFPTSEEAPEAILRLAMALEYAKDGEAKAKDWYKKLAADYARYPQAAKGAGAVKRLESQGQTLELAGTTLAGQPFSVESLKGKAVVVYYWASWSQSLPDDVRRLSNLAKDYGSKGLEIVTINLDHDAKAATQAIEAQKIPGTHLYASGGLDASPLASSYGILVVPHIFVAGKDGKIVNRSAQAATVEDDVKKLLP